MTPDELRWSDVWIVAAIMGVFAALTFGALGHGVGADLRGGCGRGEAVMPTTREELRADVRAAGAEARRLFGDNPRAVRAFDRLADVQGALLDALDAADALHASDEEAIAHAQAMQRLIAEQLWAAERREEALRAWVREAARWIDADATEAAESGAPRAADHAAAFANEGRALLGEEG